MTTASASPVPPPPPNWYLDPSNPTLQRWWSGRDWTDHTRPNPPDPYATAYTVTLPTVRQASTTRLLRTNPVGFAGTAFGLGSLILNPLLLTSIAAIVLCIIGLAKHDEKRKAGQPAYGQAWIIVGLVAAVIAAGIWAILLYRTINGLPGGY